jgi:hypothetical protein
MQAFNLPVSGSWCWRKANTYRCNLDKNHFTFPGFSLLICKVIKLIASSLVLWRWGEKMNLRALWKFKKHFMVLRYYVASIIIHSDSIFSSFLISFALNGFKKSSFIFWHQSFLNYIKGKKAEENPKKKSRQSEHKCFLLAEEMGRFLTPFGKVRGQKPQSPLVAAILLFWKGDGHIVLRESHIYLRKGGEDLDKWSVLGSSLICFCDCPHPTKKNSNSWQWSKCLFSRALSIFVKEG